MRTYKAKISFIITLLWIAVIFSFSLQPANTSSELSLGVGHWLVELLPSTLSERLLAMPREQLDFLHTLLRKTGHLSEYLILGILTQFTVLQTKLKYKKIAGILFGILVASVDETIQLFVEGRSGQVSDVLLDGVGVLCGIFVLISIIKIKIFGREESRL